MRYNSTYNAIGKAALKIATSKGWYESPRTRSQVYLLILSEVSEVIEDLRKGYKVNQYALLPDEGVDVWCWKVPVGYKGKAFGVPTELADVCIRITESAANWGLNLDKAKRTISKDFIGEDSDDPIFGRLMRVTYILSMAWAFAQEGLHKDEAAWLKAALDILFKLSDEADIDLWEAIAVKMAYNQNRPHQHGGKAF
jgi:hypothetical protein